ncbi:hypothetical protein AAG747_24165 [Rapidithrix thailandica]|uniref:Uncharacterized protein n=1 Tax=Rapidithrix thailandica TaxID=413964 RepID=A0AAW9SEW6_9BACT
MKRPSYISTKSTFTITLLVIFLTVIGVWLLGLGKERTLIENSVWSTGILSISFFLFISIGLYRGVKLQDNLGKITDRFSMETVGEWHDGMLAGNLKFPDEGDNFLINLLIWLVLMIVFSIFIWVFGAILWMGILAFVAMLYWIFFRALRLVFKKSMICKGKPDKSMLYGAGYTLMYTCWIYGVIYLVSFWKG